MHIPRWVSVLRGKDSELPWIRRIMLRGSSSGVPRIYFEVLLSGGGGEKTELNKTSSREEDIWRGFWQETKDRARGKVENSRGNFLTFAWSSPSGRRNKLISNIRPGAMIAYINWWGMFFFPLS